MEKSVEKGWQLGKQSESGTPKKNDILSNLGRKEGRVSLTRLERLRRGMIPEN